jgi:hypothetical protein
MSAFQSSLVILKHIASLGPGAAMSGRASCTPPSSVDVHSVSLSPAMHHSTPEQQVIANTDKKVMEDLKTVKAGLRATAGRVRQ